MDLKFIRTFQFKKIEILNVFTYDIRMSFGSHKIAINLNIQKVDRNYQFRVISNLNMFVVSVVVVCEILPVSSGQLVNKCHLI